MHKVVKDAIKLIKGGKRTKHTFSVPLQLLHKIQKNPEQEYWYVEYTDSFILAVKETEQLYTFGEVRKETGKLF